jgi:hypothetical protein
MPETEFYGEQHTIWTNNWLDQYLWKNSVSLDNLRIDEMIFTN